MLGKDFKMVMCPSALQDWPNSCNLNLYEDGSISVVFRRPTSGFLSWVSTMVINGVKSMGAQKSMGFTRKLPKKVEF